MGKQAAIYCRVSTAQQAAEGFSLDAQETQLREYAEQHGITVTHVEIEQESGARTDRPGLARIVEMAKAGTIDVVLVSKRDRLSRSIRDLVNVVADLQSSGVELVCPGESFDTSTPAGKAMANMIGVFAELERDMIAERVRAGMAKAKAQGRHLGRPPVGTTIVDGQLVPIDMEAVARRTDALAVAQQARANGMTYQQIADLLTEQGRPTVNGKPGTWTATGARRLLLTQTPCLWGDR